MKGRRTWSCTLGRTRPIGRRACSSKHSGEIAGIVDRSADERPGERRRPDARRAAVERENIGRLELRLAAVQGLFVSRLFLSIVEAPSGERAPLEAEHEEIISDE